MKTLNNDEKLVLKGTTYNVGDVFSNWYFVKEKILQDYILLPVLHNETTFGGTSHHVDSTLILQCSFVF